MKTRTLLAVAGIVTLTGFLAGCNRANSAPTEYPMGEKVTLGPLTYSVIEANWHSQLGDAFKIRSPQQRFLEIALSVTNGGGSDVSVPLLALQNSEGQTYLESDSGDGVENWLGLLRTISPAQTQQGAILFDVPLTSYKLRLTDGAGPGAEKYGFVTIPLRIDVDTGVETPTPGSSIK